MWKVFDGVGEICRLEDLKILGSFVSYFNLIRIHLFSP